MSDRLTSRFELFADDLGALRDFFERVLGFEVMRTSPAYIEVASGDVRIGLGRIADLPASHPLRPREATERRGIGVEIVLETDDVDAFFTHVQESGYPVATPLRAREWGQRDFRVVAPGGYYIRITSRDP